MGAPRRRKADPTSHIGFLDEVDKADEKKDGRRRKDGDLDLDRIW